jgi:hypothetical protein
MQAFLQSQAGVYVVMLILSVVGAIVLRSIHSVILRVEQRVSQHLPAFEAAQINSWLDVLDRLVATAVQDANSRIVIGLKQNGLFTKATQESVKQAVVADVMTAIGPLKEKMMEQLGPLEQIIAQLVEANVLKHKGSVIKSADVPYQAADGNGVFTVKESLGKG